jgi:hypothetical protein
LYELRSKTNELKMTEVDIKNITEKLNKAEIIIKEKETEIAVLGAQLKDTKKSKKVKWKTKKTILKNSKTKTNN